MSPPRSSQCSTRVRARAIRSVSGAASVAGSGWTARRIPAAAPSGITSDRAWAIRRPVWLRECTPDPHRVPSSRNRQRSPRPSRTPRSDRAAAPRRARCRVPIAGSRWRSRALLTNHPVRALGTDLHPIHPLPAGDTRCNLDFVMQAPARHGRSCQVRVVGHRLRLIGDIQQGLQQAAASAVRGVWMPQPRAGVPEPSRAATPSGTTSADVPARSATETVALIHIPGRLDRTRRITRVLIVTL